MKGYAVQFKTDCPHIDETNLSQKTIGELNDFANSLKISTKCNQNNCNELHENWLCVSCLGFNCSRYINGHAVEHYQNEDHPIALSMFDLSFWCYRCNRYIKNSQLTILRDIVYKAKFGEK
jgi:histone deacetylase 6